MKGQLVTQPLVEGNKSYADVNNDVCRPLESFPTKRWLAAFGASATIMTVGFGLIGLMIFISTGYSGIRSPVGWGMLVITFVFGFGVGQAGTHI